MTKQMNPAEAFAALKARIEDVDKQHEELLAQRKSLDDSLGSVLSAGGDIVAAEKRIVAIDVDIKRNRQLRVHLAETELPSIERDALIFECDETEKAAASAEAAKTAQGKKIAQLWDEYRQAEVLLNTLNGALNGQADKSANAAHRLMKHREAHPTVWADYNGPHAAMWAGYEELTGYARPEKVDEHAA